MKKILIFFVMFLFSFLTSCDSFLLEEDENILIVQEEQSEVFNINDSHELIEYTGQSHIVVIPDGVMRINSGAFSGRDDLYSVTVPSSVYTIEEGAFTECVRLVEIFNYSRVKLEMGSEDNGGIAKYARIIHKSEERSNLSVYQDKYVKFQFEDDNALIAYLGDKKDVIVPIEFDSIGAYAFYKNESLYSVILSSTILRIDEFAFAECDNLYKVVLSASLNEIGANAFENDCHIYSIVVPSSVTSIKEKAFAGCVNLVEIYNLSPNLFIYPNTGTYGGIAAYALVIHNKLDDQSIIEEENDFIYAYYNDEVYLVEYNGNDHILEIEEKVTVIMDNFCANNQLVSITIPSSVKRIEAHAFDNQKCLAEVYNNTKLKTEDYFANVVFDNSFYTPSHIKDNKKTYYYEKDNKRVLLMVYSNENYLVLENFDEICPFAMSENKITDIIMPKEMVTLDFDFVGNSNIKNIFFTSSKKEMSGSSVDLDSLESLANIYYYSETSIANHWHYTAGKVVIWGE